MTESDRMRNVCCSCGRREAHRGALVNCYGAVNAEATDSTGFS